MRQYFSFFFLVTLLILPLPAVAAPLPVVASFSILGDMVRQIGGPAVKVTVLVGPDSDTHSYDPTPADVKKIAAARLIIINGLGFEGWIPRLIKSSGTGAPVVIASQGIKASQMVDNGTTVTDPHAWQDLANGRLYVKNIAAALQAALPAEASAIATRAAAYDAELAALDKDIRARIATVPPAQRKIITSHDAFGYFGRAYGITLAAPEGISTESEPGAAAIARLGDQIRRDKVKTVFFENMADKRLITQIAHDSGAVIGGTLYADALSAPGGQAPTYLAVFRHNVPQLVAAMQQNGQ